MLFLSSLEIRRKKKSIFSQEYAEGESLGIVTLASLLILLKTVIGALTGAVNWRPHSFPFTVLLFVIVCSLGDSHSCDDSIFKKGEFSFNRLRDIDYRP